MKIQGPEYVTTQSTSDTILEPEHGFKTHYQSLKRVCLYTQHLFMSMYKGEYRSRMADHWGGFCYE